MLGALLWAKASWAAQAIAAYPVSADGLMQLVLAMLGMAGLRTFEKTTKVGK